MAVSKVLARGWLLEIQNPDTSNYVEVKGLKSITFDGTKNNADTTTFDDDGWNTHLVASRGRKITFNGMYLEDAATKARDPGQELAEALGDAIDVDSLGNFRLTSPAGTIRNIVGSVNIAGIGGGNDDATNWNLELDNSGPSAMSTITAASISSTLDGGATKTLAAVGDVSNLIVTVFTPANTSDKGLTYASSDETKAAVTPEGRVIAIASGAATITITSDSGSKTDTIAITVS